MRISSLSVVACLLTAIAAQSGSTSNPPTTPPGFTVTAGKSSTFTWQPTTSGTVTLTLRNGPSDNLNKGTVLASGITNSGSYSFTVPAGTTSGTYTIEISSDSDTSDANYSDSITVAGSDSVQSTNSSPSFLTATTSSSTVSSPTSSSSDTSTASSSTSTSSSGTSTIAAGSTTSNTKSSSSSSTSGATKSTSSSASSASGTSAPTSSTSTPTGSSKSASAGNALGIKGINYGLVAMVLGIVAVF